MISQTKSNSVANLFVNVSSSDKKTNSNTESSDFSGYMTKSLSSTDKNWSKSNENDFKNVNKTPSTRKTDNVEKKPDYNQGSNLDTGKIDYSKNEKSTTCSDDYNKNETKDIINVSEAQKKIEETVVDILDLSPEDLEKIMAILGLQFIDLLDPNNLKSLLLETTNTDITSLLTDVNLSNTLNALTESVLNINLEEFVLSPEQLSDMLKQSDESEVLDSEIIRNAFESEEIGNINSNLVQKTTEKDSNLEKKLPVIEVNNLTDGSTSSEKEVVSQTVLNSDSEKTFKDSNNSKGQDPLVDQTNAINTLINNLAGVNGTDEEFSNQLTSVREMREIVTQVVDKIKITLNADSTNFQMNLNPESLGRVNLSLTSQRGIMTAQFIVESEVTKEAIQSQLHSLKETFSQQNLIVDEIEVIVSNFGFDKGNQSSNEEGKKNTGKKKINLDGFDKVDGDSITDEDNKPNLSNNGNLVDFTA